MFNVILQYYNVYPLLCVQSYNQAIGAYAL